MRRYLRRAATGGFVVVIVVILLLLLYMLWNFYPSPSQDRGKDMPSQRVVPSGTTTSLVVPYPAP